MIKDENTDLEVTIEGSDHLYGSLLQITPVDEDNSSESNIASDRGMGEMMMKVFGNKN